MGNETKGNVAEEMEDILGLSEQDTSENDDHAENEVETSATSEEDTGDNSDNDKENSDISRTKTTALTDEQIAINQDIAKIDVQIEALEGKGVNVEDFYNDIDSHLTEEEQALEFEDKSAYMKLVGTKLKEFEQQNSSSKEIDELKEKKAELQGVYDRQSAIVAVVNEYPEFNYEKVMDFFNKELSKNEQKAIFDNSKSYEDVYVNTYKKYLEYNPTNISQQKAPDIPDVTQTTKRTPAPKDTDDGLLDDDARLQQALGL